MRPLRKVLLRAVALALLLSSVSGGVAHADGALDGGSAGVAVEAEPLESAIGPSFREDPGLGIDRLPEDPGLE